nr:hypothetical protein [Pandoravirus aubagnensis]
MDQGTQTIGDDWIDADSMRASHVHGATTSANLNPRQAQATGDAITCNHNGSAMPDDDGVMATLGAEATERCMPSTVIGNSAQAEAKASVVHSFLEWFAAKGRAPTGREAVEWVRDNALAGCGTELQGDVEGMLELVEMPEIPDSAFVVAALLLVASHMVGAWPVTILMSPQDTINFKSRSSTFIIYDAVEGAALFEHSATTSFKDVALANVVGVYVHEFLGTRPSSDDAALCNLLSMAAADIIKDE